MKRGLILGIGVLALAGMTISAEAADIARKAPVAAPPVPPPFSWTGCYIGGNLGGKRGEIDGRAGHDFDPVFFPAGGTLFPFFPFNSDSETGFVGGGQVGCQWQTGSFVWGIEGDFDGTDISRDFIVPAGTPFGLFRPGDAFSISNDWQASVRGRLGWAWDRYMIYATGGVAWANFSVDAAFVGVPGLRAPLFFSRDNTLTGWTVGGGFEWAFTPNWSLGVEYRFSHFDGDDFEFGNILVGRDLLGRDRLLAFRANADLETHEVTARINYRFNLFGGGPY